VSAFDTLERQLRESTRRRYGRAGRWRGAVGGGESATARRGARTTGGGEAAGARRGRRGAARARSAVAVPVVLLVAGVAAFLFARSPDPGEEREALAPTPAPTWTPAIKASISRSPVPAEQAAAYAVLRQPQTAADRSAAVRRILAGSLRSMMRGVRVDAVRRLYERRGRTVVLLSAEVLRMNPRDPDDDIRDGLCLFTTYTGGSAGGTCGSFEDAVSGRMRWTLPPRGLAPDGTKRVTIRVRGGRTITIVPRNNYYDASWIGESGAAGIARPHFVR
jgi:hypothetical protein